MAYRIRSYGRSFSKPKTTSNKPKYTKAERLAYNMGCIVRGNKNPNSRVHASFQNGLNGKTSRNTKPLF